MAQAKVRSAVWAPSRNATHACWGKFAGRTTLGITTNHVGQSQLRQAALKLSALSLHLA